LLYLAIFALGVGRTVGPIGGLPFLDFLAPGLVMMTLAQQAFANTSSSIIIAKVQGNIVDTLMPPFTPNELTAGLACGGVCRGLIVGVAVAVALAPFVRQSIAEPIAVAYFAVAAALMLSLLGVVAGVWAEKFEHIAAVTNFVVVPLTFLSGTFYSVDRLPSPFAQLAHANPFYFMIDGFRYGCTGMAETSPTLGATVLAIVDAVLWLLCRRLFATGYRLRT
jgi:ABC-2 type transport system permease protein